MFAKLPRTKEGKKGRERAKEEMGEGVGACKRERERERDIRPLGWILMEQGRNIGPHAGRDTNPQPPLSRGREPILLRDR